MVSGFFGFLFALVQELWTSGWQPIVLALAIGLLLGGLSWWLAHFVALGFNRQFSFHVQHHVFCAIAAAITLVFTVLFFAMQYTADVARHEVEQWESNILADRDWSSDTFVDAYEAVYALRDSDGEQVEDFSQHPHPNRGGDLIPTNAEVTNETVADVYVDSAIDHFRDQHPFLSKILWANEGVAPEAIQQDMTQFFNANPGGTYSAGDAVELAGREIRQILAEQAPRVVLISRILLVLAFLIVQGLVFGLLIRAALADIRERGVVRAAG
ncbi:hypothetical protein U5801_06545 [Lamprobacter modestohalophilus]|uniref:hypothetical protein n=1 Tax=Lamprobacter modestohalophilus TaxID=1064514 RepID=UPI002ADEA754|nr:hypothetical protein [Lamprobacter modestohalophilus]MEA1049462.1 hypothetical protein [Lamprobacter modestohalophilus]